MRLPLLIAAILCTVAMTSPALAAAGKKSVGSRKAGLTIRVEGGGWGSARKEQVEALLYSVADELLMRIPKKLTVPIVVTHTDGNPIALYDRGPDGEYQVHLHARDQRWPEYAYEFAHELCHIMSNYEENAGANTGRYNQWFEETLCETASLYTLKSLAATQDVASEEEWVRHADRLGHFAEKLIAEAHRKLPPQTPLAAWVRANEEHLRHDPYQRHKNEVVANLLLPLFEGDPGKWDALCYLNLDEKDPQNGLRQYLHNWYRNSPAEHRQFIASVFELLGVADLVASAQGTTALASPAVAAAGPAGDK